MSRWKVLNLRFIVKAEYREFFNSVVLNNKLTHNSDEILNDFTLALREYSEIYGGSFSCMLKQFGIDGAELLPIFNKATGECNIGIEYNIHNGFVNNIVREFINEFLPYIIEGKVDYVMSWIEDVD